MRHTSAARHRPRLPEKLSLATSCGSKRNAINICATSVVLFSWSPRSHAQDSSQQAGCPRGAASMKSATMHKATERKTVAAYAIPMMGHANPILRLCNALASRGHEVVFLTSSALGPKLGVLCSNSGCRFQGLEDGLTEEALKTPDAGKNPRFEEFCQRHTPLLTAALESIRPALILSDFASGAGFASARAKRIPLVINMAIPATAVQAFMMLQNSAMLFLGKRIKPGDAETLDSWSAQRCPFPLCCFKVPL